jgi:hypothetical protein
MTSSVNKGLLLNGVSVNSADELDPTGPTFSVVTAHPNSTSRITGFPVDDAGDAKLGFAGSGSLNSQLFTHSGGSWVAKTTLVNAGSDNCVGLIMADAGYALGGTADLTSVQRYLVDTDSWADHANLVANHGYCAAFRDINDPTLGVLAGSPTSPYTQTTSYRSTSSTSVAESTMNRARQLGGHGANTTSMGSGGNYGYVFGNSVVDSYCDRYDITGDAWTNVGNVTYGIGASGASAPSDQIWSCGGGGNLKTTSQMDTTAETWSAGPDLAGTARRALGCVGHTVFGVPGGSVFSHWEGWYSVTSQDDAQGKSTDALMWVGPGLGLAYICFGFNSVEQADANAYSPVTQAFTSLTPDLTGYDGLGMSDGIDVFVTRGVTANEFRKYDISGDSWSGASAPGTGRQKPAASDGLDGLGIVSHGANLGGTPLSSADRYTYGSDSWAAETGDTLALNNNTGFSDHDNKHWCVGDDPSQVTVRKYDIVGTSWSAGPDLPTGLDSACSASLFMPKRGYVAKGDGDGDGLWSIQFASSTWVQHPNGSLAANGNAQGYAWDHRFGTAGGWDGGALNRHETFDVVTNAWIAETNLPAARFGTKGGANDQHVQNRAGLVDYYIGTLTMSGLSVSTLYYVQLWAHDKFYGPFIQNNAVLLMHCDGLNGSTNFIDSSPSGHTINANGGAIHSTAQSQFGSSSLFCSVPLVDYLTIPYSAEFSFTAEFTIDCWFYATSITTNQILLATADNGWVNRGWLFGLFLSGTQLRFSNTLTAISGSTSITSGSWYHLAVTRDTSGTIRLFVNGNQVGSGTMAGTIPVTLPLYIGTDSDSAGTDTITGYMDEIRILNGEAAWTANFTPPTTPYLT